MGRLPTGAALVTLLAVAAGGVHLAAGQEPRSGEDRPAYLARATAVLVDVVVRDRQGRPVLDLKADDFEILEDGVRQEVGSFTLVSRGAGIGIGVRLRDTSPTTVIAGSSGAPPGRDAPETPAVLALVFDTLAPDALQLCQKAALDYVRMSGPAEARVGVFAADPGLRVLQRFTDDPALIRAAVRAVSPSGTEAKEIRDERIAALRERRTQMEATGLDIEALASQSPALLAQNAGAIGQAEFERQLLRSEMRMLMAFDSLDRDHRGYGSSNALMAVLESMALMPGRKGIVYFSQGLPASPTLQARLQSVVESANRSNVTIYTVDASGLRVLSGTAETRKEIEAAGEERLRQVALGELSFDGPLTRQMERTEDLIRFNPQGGLEQLARDTGGFLIRDTNDIGAAFRRVDEDLRFHYLLTYAPRNDVFDGKFRSIQVKLRRPGLQVFARSGYRAVRAPAGVPVLTYEAPALALLDGAPLPNAFPSRATAFAFPEVSRPGLTPIVVRVTTDALAFDTDTKKGTYSAQAAVVVRIRNRGGEVVQKMSQQYVLSGEAKELDGARKGEILFYREPELPPGVYDVESIVYDAVAEKGSARVSTIVVPGAEAPQLRMSSLVVVSRTERTSTPGTSVTPPETTPPFYYGDVLLYPNLGEPIVREPDGALSFYFVVYPAPDRCACRGRIALLRSGQQLAEAPLELAAGDSQQRIQHVGQLPVGNLPSGTYELRVTVTDGKDQQVRRAFFTLS